MNSGHVRLHSMIGRERHKDTLVCHFPSRLARSEDTMPARPPRRKGGGTLVNTAKGWGEGSLVRAPRGKQESQSGGAASTNVSLLRGTVLLCEGRHCPKHGGLDG